MPFDSTCGGCWHHGDSSGGSGQCRALPPSYDESPPSSTVMMIYAPVKVMTYILTADECPACGLYRPLVEPEAPPPETKAERIARLCRAGKVSVAEIKRALDGR